MKKTILISILAVGIFACNNTGNKPSGTNKTEAVNENFTLKYVADTTKSIIKWKGSMLGVYAHEGTVKLQEGNLLVNKGNVTSGNFTVDLNTIITTDDDALYKMAPREKLIGHLKSDDFFSTEKFPEAFFEIKSVDGNTITGNLTIKGVTQQATITELTVNETDYEITATGNLVLNRQKFGVSYKNTMNDMVLADDIELKISVIGKIM